MIHLFERAGKRLVLDVGSGSVHILDAPAYALLQALTCEDLQAGLLPEAVYKELTEFPKENLQSAFSELCRLQQVGQLYTEDDYQEFAPQLGLSPVKAMCLHIAHDCNLRCKYCFASTGGFGGTRKLMSEETAKQAVDLLVGLSGTRRNLEVDFFGGEPLMGMDVVKKTVAYARSREKEKNKNFRFTITTNGLLLNEDSIDFINREMSNVVLSIDGRREVNDALRVRVDGRGSYDAVVPAFQQLVQRRGDKEYYVRGTYTRFNPDFDADVLALYELGFDQISVEPVVGPEKDDYSIREADIPALEASYERLMWEMIRRKKEKKGRFNFFHFMLDLEGGPCALKRLRGCGSGNEYVAVTPDGEIYPCHQFVGNPDFLMGDVEQGIANLALKQQFADANLLHKPDCQGCWAKFFCSGGCNANNYQFTGSVLKPYRMACVLEKIRLECAIGVQAALAE